MSGRAWWAASAILAAIGAGGCEPLASGPTYETPLLSFEAKLADVPGTADLAVMNMGIVWVDPLAVRDDLPQPPDGLRVTKINDLVFKVDLFAPPPERAIRRYPEPTTGEVAVSFAFGEIALYDDNDDDGEFAISSRKNGSLMIRPDAYRGSNNRRAVVFVETPAKAGALNGNVWRTLTEGPGLRLVNISCNGTTASVTTLMPPDLFGNFTVEREPSAEMIVTRPCISPARPAIDAMP